MTEETNKYDVKLGPFTWSYSERLDEDLKKNLGECSFENLQILIRDDLNNDIKVSTIFHELFHAAFASSGMMPKNEEVVVDVLACQLLFFLKNNPEFLEYLKKYL